MSRRGSLHSDGRIAALLVLGSVAVLAGCRGSTLRAADRESAPAPAPIPGAESNMVAAPAAKVAPSVVDVHTEGKPISMASSPFPDSPFFGPFFGGPNGTDQSAAPRRVPKGAGSGVIISADGYILTNQHVIANVDKMTVKVGDKAYDARVIGSDSVTDIAVVKMDPQGATLRVAEMGNSDDVHVGDWAIAVGNPLDIGTTVTLGIISAVKRSGMAAEGHPLNSVLQTDAAINPGNSGGALANIRGQIIGINEAIASPTGAYVGIGFAIPSNSAKKIADELIQHGKIVRPYLGVAYVPVKAIPPQSRQQLGLPATGDDGVVVRSVQPGSPADQAGLKPKDLILEANGKKITDSNVLNDVVQSLKVGDTVSLVVSRGGSNRTVRVRLRERPENYGQVTRPQGESPDLVP